VWQRIEDPVDDDEVLRRVEQRKRGALPGSLERCTRRELVASFDVAGRKRAQRAADL
jgi:hypothetical protein